jgi:tight adherence protein B
MNREERPATQRLGPLLAVLVATVPVSIAVHSLIPTLVFPSATAYALQRRSRAGSRASQAAQRTAVIDLCAAIRADLEAGRHPDAALAEAVRSRPELADLAANVSNGSPWASDPAPRMRAAAGVPGRQGLIAVAAAWQAAHDHGISLAATLAGIEEGLRAEQQNRQALDAELSGIRATTTLLALLPLFGLMLGTALGAHPIHAALTRPVAEYGLSVGLLLQLVGMSWTDRLIAAAEDGEPRSVRGRALLAASALSPVRSHRALDRVARSTGASGSAAPMAVAALTVFVSVSAYAPVSVHMRALARTPESARAPMSGRLLTWASQPAERPPVLGRSSTGPAATNDAANAQRPSQRSPS